MSFVEFLPRPALKYLLAACAFMLVGPEIPAAQKAAVVVDGTHGPVLLEKEAAGKWRILKDLDIIMSGAHLVGGVGATIDSIDGAVRLSMRGDVAGLSPFPILETALTLNEPKGVDLAFEMDRGRIDLVNRKTSGSAKINLTIRGRTALITLADPGDRIAIEIYGRWPKGVGFQKKPMGKHEPALAVLAIAVKGETYIKGASRTVGLKAPPGPAMIIMDDLEDTDPQVQWLETLPEWVNYKDPERRQKITAVTNKFKAEATKKSIGAALAEMVASDDPVERRGGVVLMGATDELKLLAEAMATTKYPDVWDEGVIILRHWIGRGPGQDMKLYAALLEAKIPEADAEVIMQLLHSFSDAAKRKPELYQALIDYLDSDRLAIRGLAHWHLVRLVPQGRKIEYNIHDTKEIREKAIKSWRDLIPPGSVPGKTAEKK